MKVIQLDKEGFKKEVFDYEASEEFKYIGKKSAIIDFYADWCAPCKALAPVLDELADKYADDIIIYKIDTEAEQELSAMFNIRSIPTMLFIPLEGKPTMSNGALPKNELVKIIEGELR
jgi:thioredoxin 1